MKKKNEKMKTVEAVHTHTHGGFKECEKISLWQFFKKDYELYYREKFRKFGLLKILKRSR